MHVEISVGEKRIAQWGENTRLIAAEVVGEDQVQGGAGLRLVVVMPVRIVPATAIGDLLCCESEEKEIVFASLFGHLDGGAVARANRECSVHHEFHVASAAGFVTRGGNLIRDVAGRNQTLRERNSVVRKKQNLQAPFHEGVAIDGASEIVDEL